MSHRASVAAGALPSIHTRERRPGGCGGVRAPLAPRPGPTPRGSTARRAPSRGRSGRQVSGARPGPQRGAKGGRGAARAAAVEATVAAPGARGARRGRPRCGKARRAGALRSRGCALGVVRTEARRCVVRAPRALAAAAGCFICCALLAGGARGAVVRREPSAALRAVGGRSASRRPLCSAAHLAGTAVMEELSSKSPRLP